MENIINKFENLLDDYDRKQITMFRNTNDTNVKKAKESKIKLIEFVLSLVETKEDVEKVYYYDLQHEFGTPSGSKSGEQLKEILLELLKKYSRVLVLANGVEKHLDYSFINEAFGGLIPHLGSKEEVMRRVTLYTIPIFKDNYNSIDKLYRDSMNNSIYNLYKSK